MHTTTTRYPHVAAYADAIAAQGPHPAKVGRKSWDTDGEVIYPARGGEGMDLADLRPGGLRRAAVIAQAERFAQGG